MSSLPLVVEERLLHLSEDPGSTALLRQLLMRADLDFDVVRIDHAEALERELGAGNVRLILADLPMPWPEATEQVQAIQKHQPQCPVIFRWGDPGYGSVEPPELQLANTIRQALRRSPAKPLSAAERQVMVAELVLHQQLLLELAKLTTSDTQHTLAEITRRASQQLTVARVSVWDFDATRQKLRCVVMYDHATRTHLSGATVAGHPRYRAALDHALQIAATDAWVDPRTSEFLDDYLRPNNIRAMLDAPVRLQGVVSGVLCFEHTGAPRVWTMLEQCFATSLAALVSRVLAERERQNSVAAAQRHERLAAIGRVAATSIHDLANQLTAISGMVDELATCTTPAGAKVQRVLRGTVATAMQKVRGLLAVGSLVASNGKKLPRIELGAAVHHLLPVLASTLGPSIRLDVTASDAPLAVTMDEGDLRDALLNLAANARDALAGRGKVHITLGRTEHGLDGPPAARLLFADDGPGIPDAIRDQLFEPFVSTKDADHGTGLGLATVHEIVHRCHGRIAVETSAEGTQFVIDLPLQDAGHG